MTLFPLRGNDMMNTFMFYSVIRLHSDGYMMVFHRLNLSFRGSVEMFSRCSPCVLHMFSRCWNDAPRWHVISASHTFTKWSFLCWWRFLLRRSSEERREYLNRASGLRTDDWGEKSPTPGRDGEPGSSPRILKNFRLGGGTFDCTTAVRRMKVVQRPGSSATRWSTTLEISNAAGRLQPERRQELHPRHHLRLGVQLSTADWETVRGSWQRTTFSPTPKITDWKNWRRRRLCRCEQMFSSHRGRRRLSSEREGRWTTGQNRPAGALPLPHEEEHWRAWTHHLNPFFWNLRSEIQTLHFAWRQLQSGPILTRFPAWSTLPALVTVVHV